MLASCLLVLALADTGTTADSVAGRRDTPPWWEVRAVASVEPFARDLSAWQHHTLTLARRAEALSFSVEGWESRRFDRWDRGLGADVTKTLWPKSYADVRASYASDPAIVAQLDLSGEIYQGLPGGWEIAPGARLMRFHPRCLSGDLLMTCEEFVPIYGLALGRYVGDWYVRGRGTLTPHAGTTGGSGSLLVRRYFGGSTDMLEAQAGRGREVVTLPARVDLRGTSFVAARGQRLVTRTVGLTVGATATRYQGFPLRRGGSLGVFARF